MSSISGMLPGNYPSAPSLAWEERFRVPVGSALVIVMVPARAVCDDVSIVEHPKGEDSTGLYEGSPNHGDDGRLGQKVKYINGMGK